MFQFATITIQLFIILFIWRLRVTFTNCIIPLDYQVFNGSYTHMVYLEKPQQSTLGELFDAAQDTAASGYW